MVTTVAIRVQLLIQSCLVVIGSWAECVVLRHLSCYQLLILCNFIGYRDHVFWNVIGCKVLVPCNFSGIVSWVKIGILIRIWGGIVAGVIDLMVLWFSHCLIISIMCRVSE